jgi:hypothetical protein
VERQPRIEEALSKRHLAEGCAVLYDLSSSYFEGTHCPLAKHGYSRDSTAKGISFGPNGTSGQKAPCLRKWCNICRQGLMRAYLGELQCVVWR